MQQLLVLFILFIHVKKRIEASAWRPRCWLLSFNGFKLEVIQPITEGGYNRARPASHRP